MQHLQHITELGSLLTKLDIRQVIIAPGSRNAPLTQLFTASSSFICHSIVDERSSGYVALGMARQLRQPVAVVVTSGTAVLNLAPAIAESFYEQVPLIILTADRPLEDIRQFNNQVIDQMAPYYNYSKGFFEFPPVFRSDQELTQALIAAEQLLLAAITQPAGPVHLNFLMEEPLYEKLPEPVLLPNSQTVESYPPASDSLVLESWNTGNKVMLLAGMGVWDKEIQSVLEKLTRTKQLVLMAENIANVPGDWALANPELILGSATEMERNELAPDLVIAFGGQVVSKRLKLFIQSLKDVETKVIDGNPLEPLNELVALGGDSEGEVENSYFQLWKKIQIRGLERADQFLKKAAFCNLTSMKDVLTSMPSGTVVHLGNSAIIRYSQLMRARQDLTYFSNRGTSGIDGSVSAAVGAAMVTDQLHVLLVGDLSFVFDSNALWNKAFPSNLRIIIFNDAGGGIFRLLDGSDRMEFFEEFSVTHHPISLELLSQSYGRRFQRACNGKELLEKLELFYQQDSSYSILEVDTTGSENSLIFKEFFKQIQ